MSKYVCASCKKDIEAFSIICPQCGYISDIKAMGPFQLLGLEARFDLDEVALERAYFEGQYQVHPDRFVKAEPEVREKAAVWSIHLNEAYQTLKAPLKRAQALYKELKGTLPTQASGNEQLLQDMMELQEALGDNAELGKTLVSDQIGACEEALRIAFRDALEEVPVLIERFSYLKRLSGDA